jgi:hypothetical protein
MFYQVRRQLVGFVSFISITSAGLLLLAPRLSLAATSDDMSSSQVQASESNLPVEEISWSTATDLSFTAQISEASAPASKPRGSVDYPVGPDLSMTPGSLCDHPDQRRYPEKIAYCNRNVESSLKWDIIRAYDQKPGIEINESNRGNFKIDHLIPLCAGGGNDTKNLWPQHKNIYQQTDPLEPLVCGKMSQGVLKQSRAIELIMRAKLNLSLVPEVMRELEAM